MGAGVLSRSEWSATDRSLMHGGRDPAGAHGDGQKQNRGGRHGKRILRRHLIEQACEVSVQNGSSRRRIVANVPPGYVRMLRNTRSVFGGRTPLFGLAI
jgi:hypothetical protein